MNRCAARASGPENKRAMRVCFIRQPASEFVVESIDRCFRGSLGPFGPGFPEGKAPKARRSGCRAGTSSPHPGNRTAAPDGGSFIA
ncbi:hypothetical protein, partial [Burkholderia thailandensis]|uniref:hypothetical protein n=1 Tax=Burkholderia thailandensis TaxID=57975 RepID=UPI001CA547A2